MAWLQAEEEQAMIAVVAITKEGEKIATILASSLKGESQYFFSVKGALKGLVGRLFDKNKYEGIVFIMALGVVVRLIAPYLKNKFLDPAVVVVDGAGRFALSVVSGHEGGANELAIKIGNILEAEPVITTGSETKKNLVIGLGCRRGVTEEEVLKALKAALAKAQASIKKVRYLATVDIKKNEAGLVAASLALKVPLRIISAETIRNYKGRYHRSSFVKKKIGLEGVSEPCALIAGRRAKLILPKTKIGGVAVAMAREASR